MTLHHRREAEHLPQALRELLNLQLRETVHVSELLEIPSIVASTDLMGPMASRMRSFLEKRRGLRVLAIPLELPAVPINMIWHETRSKDAGHRWLREIVMAEVRRLAST